MKRIINLISLAVACYVLFAPLSFPVEARAKKQTESAQSETVKSAESKADSNNGQLWIDSSTETPENNSDFQYQSPGYESETHSKPFTIIGLIVLSLAVVIGIMIWSINTVNNKKKVIEEVPSTSPKKSNFKILDSLILENGKTLYLIQAFGKNLIIGSSWSSISLIGEIDELPKEIATNIKISEVVSNTKQVKTSNLDFLTSEDQPTKSIAEVGIKRIFGESEDSGITLPAKPIQIVPSNEASENIVNEKISSQPLTSKKEIKTSFRDERKKIYEQHDWKSLYSSIEPPSTGQIKRSYSDSGKTGSDTQTKRPSWLREKEARINAIEASFAEKENKKNDIYDENVEKPSNQNSEIPTIENLNLDALPNINEREETQISYLSQSQILNSSSG
ncbi:MAG: hypothetical protein SFU25_06910, partial [Candidatus Caenarcaniphilales bacterium]|nr:hypothetical protein [Candidatus Caenarcaniphilales bacterium]